VCMISDTIKSMKLDYLIIGQGLAGTILAYTLQSRGLQVKVVDSQHLPSSSRVAAGIFNPVTGKRPVKTWQADVLFPFLHTFYRQMEADLNEQFFYPKPVFRPFLSIAEQNTGFALTESPDISTFLECKTSFLEISNFIENNLGGLQTKHSGYLAVDYLINCYRQNLTRQQALINKDLSYDDLVLKPDGVEWGELKARKIIFCEGIHAMQNPYFQWLPFRQVKGEILTIEVNDTIPDYIFKQGVYLVPNQNNTCKVGATYDRFDTTWETTDKAQEDMTSVLESWLKPTYRVVNQQAGIRPASPDQKPLIGLHPEFPSLGIFNGMGSKGVSMAPYYAQHFYERLECQKELSETVNINRYFSLYFK
jgi:glycine/D-amino acid oxidase-like deaminating enzyme